MKDVYLIILNFFANLTIRKNNFFKNYFDPKEKEAQNIYNELLIKISASYPEIKNEVIFEINKDIKYSIAECREGFYRVLISGQVIFRKRKNLVYIYSSVFNLLGHKKINYYFVVAHELFHVVHYIYYKEDFLSASPKRRECFANRKAIEFLEDYYPNISLEKYNNIYKNSSKIIFWHKMINNFIP